MSDKTRSSPKWHRKYRFSHQSHVQVSAGLVLSYYQRRWRTWLSIRLINHYSVPLLSALWIEECHDVRIFPSRLHRRRITKTTAVHLLLLSDVNVAKAFKALRCLQNCKLVQRFTSWYCILVRVRALLDTQCTLFSDIKFFWKCTRDSGLACNLRLLTLLPSRGIVMN